MEIQDNSIFLPKNVESVLAEEQVVCSNIAEESYEVAAQTRTGLTAALALPGYDKWLRLGAGQTFTFKEQVWEVLEVTREGMSVQLQESDSQEEE